VEDALAPGRAAGLGADRADGVDELRLQAAWTRSLLRSSVTSKDPTTTASATVYASSLSRGATVQSFGRSRSCISWTYQTSHSSKEMLIFLLVESRAATWSAVATTSWMKLSMFRDEARKLARSSSWSS